MTRNYVLANAAGADMRGTIRYTRTQWNDAQILCSHKQARAKPYPASLWTGIVQSHGCALSEGTQAHCEHHYVFCLPPDNEPALIVGIFPERMDQMARLRDGLGVTST